MNKLIQYMLALVCCFLFSSTALAKKVSGVFQVVKGEVTYITKRGKEKKARVGKKIKAGETVVTAKDSRAKIVYPDGNELNISPDTKLKIERYETKEGNGKGNVSLDIIYGKMRSNVKEKYDGAQSKFRVKTPSAVAGVRGTDFVSGFDQSSGQSKFVTFSGSVAVGTPGPGGALLNPVTVQPGQFTTATAGAPPAAPAEVPQNELASLDNETQAEGGAAGSSDERQPAASEDSGGDEEGSEESGDEPQEADGEADDQASNEESSNEESSGEEPAGDEPASEETAADESADEPAAEEGQEVADSEAEASEPEASESGESQEAEPAETAEAEAEPAAGEGDGTASNESEPAPAEEQPAGEKQEVADSEPAPAAEPDSAEPAGAEGEPAPAGDQAAAGPGDGPAPADAADADQPGANGPADGPGPVAAGDAPAGPEGDIGPAADAGPQPTASLDGPGTPEAPAARAPASLPGANQMILDGDFAPEQDFADDILTTYTPDVDLPTDGYIVERPLDDLADQLDDISDQQGDITEIVQENQFGNIIVEIVAPSP